jgi:hypothetical protein
VRSYSPKYSSRLPVYQRAAGECLLISPYSLLVPNTSPRIVEFASHEDSQRAIRELSEQPLLGRPVFIREVSLTYWTHCLAIVVYNTFRTEKTRLDSVLRPFQVKWVWLWLVKACMRLRLRDHPPTTTLVLKTILATNSTSAT